MIKELISQFIKKEDFKRLRHIILMRNDTSGTQVNKPRQSKLLELKEDGVILALPKDSCRKGHNVTLFIFKSPMKMKVSTLPTQGKVKGSYEIMGKVRAIETPEEGNGCSVDIELTQFDEFEWKKFVSQYKQAQKKATELSVKGQE